MDERYLICNFSFADADGFQPFTVHGYHFSPVSCGPDGLPGEVRANAAALALKPQPESVLRHGAAFPREESPTFLDDLLVLVSICLGRAVERCRGQEPPPAAVPAGGGCPPIARSAAELTEILQRAIPRLLDQRWQANYACGLHLRKLYDACQIEGAEQRFLAQAHIWEYLYYCNHQTRSFAESRLVKLQQKMAFVAGKYLLDGMEQVEGSNLRLFAELSSRLSGRGRVTRGGGAAVMGERSRGHYLALFESATRTMVLKTLGVEALPEIGMELRELLLTGSVRAFEALDGAAVRVDRLNGGGLAEPAML